MKADEKTIQIAYEYVLKRGFPYYQYSEKEKINEFNKIKRYNLEKIIQNDIVRQTMHGLGLAWSYFPHAWNVKTRKMLTPYEIFQDNEKLKKAIERRLNRGGLEMIRNDGSMTDAQIRKALKSYSGVQSVSNFRPTAASAIYKNFVNNGIVWDMSSGFGGRLFGALLSNSVKKYIGTDPSSPTMKGLQNIKKDFSFIDMEVELHKIGSENFVPSDKVDLCFTSPPYFNTEKYSNDKDQSFISYDSIDLWNEKFLRKTISNCHQCLKDKSLMIINVANVITHKNLEFDTIKIATEEGFELVNTLKLQLSSITKGGFKYEPIFVFKKL